MLVCPHCLRGHDEPVARQTGPRINWVTFDRALTDLKAHMMFGADWERVAIGEIWIELERHEQLKMFGMFSHQQKQAIRLAESLMRSDELNT